MLMFAWLAMQAAAPSPCLGQPLDTCLAAIKTQFHFKDEQVRERLGKLDKVDVNGKPLSPERKLLIFIWEDSEADPTVIDLTLSDKNVVQKVSVGVTGRFLELAKSADDYDSTSIIKSLSAALPSSCWSADKLNLYRWFENSVKPALIHDPVERKFSDDRASETYFVHSKPLSFCGYKVQYADIYGKDTNDIASSNPTGVSSLASFDIEP